MREEMLLETMSVKGNKRRYTEMQPTKSWFEVS